MDQRAIPYVLTLALENDTNEILTVTNHFLLRAIWDKSGPRALPVRYRPSPVASRTSSDRTVCLGRKVTR